MLKSRVNDGGANIWLRGLFTVALLGSLGMTTLSADSAPTVTLTTGPTSTAVNAATTYTFHVEDPDGDLNGWEIAYQTPSGGIGQFITWQTISNTSVYEFSQAVTFNTPGTWQIWVNARDAAGHVRDPWAHNIPSDRLTVTVTSVNSPPTVTRTSGPSRATVGAPTTYSFHVEDPDGNLNAWEVAYQAPSGAIGQFITWQGIANTGVYDFGRSVVFNTPGTWHIWVNGRDSNGLVRDPWANNIPSDRYEVVVTSSVYSTPSYTPSFWNDWSTVQYYNNCYNYSNNKRTDTFAQPGRAAGQMATSMTASAVSTAAMADGLEPASASSTSPTGKTLIALVIWPGRDYHWYRRDNNGLWSHKPGQTQATNLDNSGNLITNPETANRGNYTVFAGYFFTPSDSTEGAGHANIN